MVVRPLRGASVTRNAPVDPTFACRQGIPLGKSFFIAIRKVRQAER